MPRNHSPRLELGGASGRLDALSPLGVLRRGYAIARGPDGRVLRAAAQARPGDTVDVRLGDSAAAGQMDLLSVVLHELGHVLGLEDDYWDINVDHVMNGWLEAGMRRVLRNRQ